MTEIADFLLARVNEMSLQYGFTTDSDGDDYNNDDMLAHCDALRKVIEHHKLWPVLVEKQESPATFADAFEPDINQVVFKMNRELAWATEQAYIKHFGTDPPTAPILRYLVQPYSEHPDFKPEWLLS